MTSSTRRLVALVAIAVATAALPSVADAKLLPPAGPWPAPVAGATNPLLGTPFIFNGANATANPAIRFWLPVGRSRRISLTRTFGERTVVRAQLTNRDNGLSIVGATVHVAAQSVQGGDWYVAAIARTNASGSLRAMLPPGPTRRVGIVYWPFVSSPAPLVSPRVLVRTSARVYLKTAMLGNRQIVYRGRVSGAAIPPGGLVLAAQVRNGRVWATVKLVRTYQSGRFVARYRFKYRGRRFQVRALVPTQPAWPLYSGHSKPRLVRSL